MVPRAISFRRTGGMRGAATTRPSTAVGFPRPCPRRGSCLRPVSIDSTVEVAACRRTTWPTGLGINVSDPCRPHTSPTFAARSVFLYENHSRPGGRRRPAHGPGGARGADERNAPEAADDGVQRREARIRARCLDSPVGRRSTRLRTWPVGAKQGVSKASNGHGFVIGGRQRFVRRTEWRMRFESRLLSSSVVFRILPYACACACACVWWCGVAAGLAADWPHQRGPLQNGIVPPDVPVPASAARRPARSVEACCDGWICRAHRREGSSGLWGLSEG